MINKLVHIEFDDVIEDKNGNWTQVCKSCVDEKKLSVWDDIPIENLICGVKNCTNEASFYFDFK